MKLLMHFQCHKIDEFYNYLVNSYEEGRYDIIEQCITSLSQKIQETPDDINVQAQNNILWILMYKWGFSKYLHSTSLGEHATKILDIAARISELLAYPYLSNTLHEEIGTIWRTWFITEYITEFFIPKIDTTFNIESKKELESLLEIDEEQQTTFLELILNLLLRCVDTCILTSCNDVPHPQDGATKIARPSQGFIFRNIGKLDLLEINVQFIFEVLKHSNLSHLVFLEKLDSILQEFIAFASSEWFIKSHRTLHHCVVQYFDSDIDTRNEVLNKYIQMIQLLEHCYYKKTGGKSIPAPLPSQSTESAITSSDLGRSFLQAKIT